MAKYFDLGLKHSEILFCMQYFHDDVFSIRTLKRIMHHKGLFRRKYNTDIMKVVEYIAAQCEEFGQMHGYRWMHAKCLKQSLVVSQDTVRQIMHIIAPAGIEERKARRLQRRKYLNPGPNNVWHVDGYDKLSMYGICIHGCIDGYSRKVIWLKAAHTNKDPRVIGSYFLESIIALKKCPRRVRADRGTENRHIEQMQIFLRRNHTDCHAGENSFLYGRSTLNQRIESMWGMVRRQGIQYWMNLFQGLVRDGHFDGGILDQELIRFCFMDIVQVKFLNISYIE